MMKSIAFNGYKVRYKRTGTGKPIVFLHNAGSDHRIWDYQIDAFKKTHEIFALDILGYGSSDRPHVEYSLNLYTDMLKTFIETLDLHEVVLVGHCIGGATSINYSYVHPERIRALVVFNVASEQSLIDGAYGFLYKLKQHEIVRKVLVYTAPRIGLPEWYIALELKKLYGTVGEKEAPFLEHMKSLYKKEGHLRILNNLLLNFDTFRVIDERVKPENFPPVMLIWGRENKVLRLTAGKKFAETFNPDKTVIFNHCGHLVMRENPDEVNQCIKEFIPAHHYR